MHEGRKTFGLRKAGLRKSRKVARADFDVFGSPREPAGAAPFWTSEKQSSDIQGQEAQSLLPVLNIFFSFRGRLTRFSYWLSSAMMTLLMFAMVLRLPDLQDPVKMYTTPTGVIVNLVFGYIFAAIAAKRWHDRNKSGWWSLLSFVPVLGPLWVLFELGSLPGTPGKNQYG